MSVHVFATLLNKSLQLQPADPLQSCHLSSCVPILQKVHKRMHWDVHVAGLWCCGSALYSWLLAGIGSWFPVTHPGLICAARCQLGIFATLIHVCPAVMSLRHVPSSHAAATCSIIPVAPRTPKVNPDCFWDFGYWAPHCAHVGRWCDVIPLVRDSQIILLNTRECDPPIHCGYGVLHSQTLQLSWEIKLYQNLQEQDAFGSLLRSYYWHVSSHMLL